MSLDNTLPYEIQIGPVMYACYSSQPAHTFSDSMMYDGIWPLWIHSSRAGDASHCKGRTKCDGPQDV